MLTRKIYLIFLSFALIIMSLGQFMARPQYYGTQFGRAWAHAFWFGFLLFLGTILTWFIRYITDHKNPKVVDTGKYQFRGVISITGLVGLCTVGAILMGDDALTGYDGNARKGVFIIWLLLLLIFTVFNIAILIFRQLKLAKRL